jgi:hypothetical protein
VTSAEAECRHRAGIQPSWRVDHNAGAGVVPLAGGLILTANNNKVNGNAGGPGSTTGALLIM